MLVQSNPILLAEQPSKDIKDTVSQGASTAFDVRSSKLLRRIYEITEPEKAGKWDQMVNSYYQEGV